LVRVCTRSLQNALGGEESQARETPPPDSVTPAQLRHSSVSVTQACYIKARDVAVVDAMARLETKLTESLIRDEAPLSVEGTITIQ